MMDWDENQIFPKEVFHKLGELGLMGVLVPEEYGGSGLSYFEYITAIEELSIIDPSIGLSVRVTFFNLVMKNKKENIFLN